MTGKQLLSKKVSVCDEEMTIKEFFKDVLTALVEQGEGFSGKRPGFDSSWWFCLDEQLRDVDRELLKAIKAL